MEKIESIKFKKLWNEQMFQFTKEVKLFTEESNPVVLGIVHLYPTFVSLHQEIDQTLEWMDASIYTAQLVAKDTERDDCYNRIKGLIKNNLKNSDPNKKEAARRLNLLLNVYGDVAKAGYDKETGLVYNFVQDLNGKFINEVMRLDLKNLVDELEHYNSEFENLSLTRNAEEAEKPEHTMSYLRREIYKCYLKIVKRIESQMDLGPTPALTTFVKKLNARVIHYNNVIAQREGRKKN